MEKKELEDKEKKIIKRIEYNKQLVKDIIILMSSVVKK